MVQFPDADAAMRRAILLAGRGRGLVEPNPMVGAVLVDQELRCIEEGWHQRFGGPHAEIDVLQKAGDRACGQTMFVTLEPCCHFGKTGPCTRAVIGAGIRRVVIGTRDPAPHVNGGGIAELVAAGVEVQVGCVETECRRLIAPFVRRVTHGLPWVHAKWAMTLDGKIAARTGHSQWISNVESRRVVHGLRGLMDGVLVGAGTVRTDDPRLTPRPPGCRTPARIVVDSTASLCVGSQLVKSLAEAPVVVLCGDHAPLENIERLTTVGVEVVPIAQSQGRSADSDPNGVNLHAAMRELCRRGMTHILAEGGSGLLGSLFDLQLIDECHVFVSPKLVGGRESLTPIGGNGLPAIPESASLEDVETQVCDGDVYIHGRVRRQHEFCTPRKLSPD